MKCICEAMKNVRKYFTKSDKVEYYIVRTKEPYMFLLRIKTPFINYETNYAVTNNDTAEELTFKIISDFIIYVTR